MQVDNQNVHRYVYYGCTRNKDKHCACGYIEEKDLIGQFENILEEIGIDEIGMKDKIREEVQRIKKFQKSILGVTQEISITDVDIRDYAKFILKEGSVPEKRDLLGCLRGKITLKDKKVSLKS